MENSVKFHLLKSIYDLESLIESYRDLKFSCKNNYNCIILTWLRVIKLFPIFYKVHLFSLQIKQLVACEDMLGIDGQSGHI